MHRKFYTGMLCLAVLISAMLLVPGTQAAIAVSQHQIKHHLAWKKAKEAENWVDWQKAFKKTDKDNDGTIALAQIKTFFKEHYNLYHKDVHHHEHEVQSIFCLCAMWLGLGANAFLKLLR